MKNVKEIKINIEKEEWTKILKDTFNKKKKDIKIDGFRKGSVTWDLYIKKFGIESLYNDAVNTVLDMKYADALNEAQVEPVVQPSADIKEISEDGVSVSFTFISKPIVELGKYTKLGVKKETAKVTKRKLKQN